MNRDDWSKLLEDERVATNLSISSLGFIQCKQVTRHQKASRGVLGKVERVKWKGGTPTPLRTYLQIIVTLAQRMQMTPLQI